VRHDTLLFTMILAFAGVIAGVAGVNVVEVFFVRETLGASATAYGFITAAWTAGMVVGAWVFARLVKRSVGDDGALVYGVLALLGACCLAVTVGAGATGVAVVVLLWLLGGLGNGGLGVLQNIVLARRVPEAARGRAFAAFNGATQGAAMFGYFVGGLLLERLTPRGSVLTVGLAGLLVVAVAAVPVVRAVRRERAGLVTSAAVR
jgi:MFS family permease